VATPEGKVKKIVKEILLEFGSHVDGFWPVPYGYGESHLDWVGCVNGHFVCIETKRPDKDPTPRQLGRIRSVRAAGGIAIVIDGTSRTTTYEELRSLLTRLCGP
jgi:hypothetical protein